jgi:lipoprotein-anchoring transpeptidase ErfK/SrfK
MRRIKKARDIIIIIIAVTVIIVLADMIIPISINRDIYENQVTDADRNIEEADSKESSSDGIVKVIKLDMLIDASLFTPKKNIFATVPVNSKKEYIEDPGEKEPDKQEIAEEGNDTGLESDQAEAGTASIDREAIEETPEDGQETVLQEDNIDYSRSEDFRIEIDLARQMVIVFHKDDVLREMMCSGGAPDSPTPLGEYVTSQKIEYAWVERFGVGAYYWIRFFEDYLIHSVPFDENGEMILEEYEKLGNPASHGCIRLKLEEARWLYETLPLGVKVVIYQ